MKTLESDSADLLDAPRPAVAARVKAPPAPKTAPRSPGKLLAVITLLLGAGLLIGIIPRWRDRDALREQTEALSIPTVSIVQARIAKNDESFLLPGEVRPFIEAPIYARTNGYVKRWFADIGAKVKAGDVLAEIDTPDLDQQLANARAQAAQAEAAEKLAKSTAVRYNTLRKTSAISAQDADERNSDAEAKAAAAEAARASVRRSEELQAFQKVLAPFDGVVTLRNTDVGQLVSSAGGQPLFQLTQSHVLRVFVHVPEAQIPSIAVDQKARVSFPEYPGRQFEAVVVRTAGAIDLTSRTLLAELRLDNAQGEVLAGSHAEVRFTITASKPVLTLPANALLFRSEGPQAGVVQADGKVEMRSIVMGRDFGREIEILAGISEQDHVILNPPDSLTGGGAVRVIEAKVKPGQPARL